MPLDASKLQSHWFVQPLGFGASQTLQQYDQFFPLKGGVEVEALAIGGRMLDC